MKEDTGRFRNGLFISDMVRDIIRAIVLATLAYVGYEMRATRLALHELDSRQIRTETRLDNVIAGREGDRWKASDQIAYARAVAGEIGELRGQVKELSERVP